MAVKPSSSSSAKAAPAPKHPLEQAIDPKPLHVPLTLAGGALMGVANIIPGVSGGTMILALGLYEEFIESAASVTRLRRAARPYMFLGLIGAAAMGSILLLSSVIKSALANYHVPTFALFIGLALGGLPIIWGRLEKVRPADWLLAAAGFAAMFGVAVALGKTDLPASWPILFFAGAIASAAMVLPGISGSHLLLVMGLYGPIIDAVSAFKDALKAADIAAAWGPAFSVILPVGLGVLAGIVILTNVLERLLERRHQATMAALLGLLAGSVFPMNPFRAPGHKDLFEAAAPMTAGNLGLVAGMIALGFVLTLAIGKLGGGEKGDYIHDEDAAEKA